MILVALRLLGAFEILYRKGEYLKEMTEDFEPSFRRQGHILEVQRRTWKWQEWLKTQMTRIGE